MTTLKVKDYSIYAPVNVSRMTYRSNCCLSLTTTENGLDYCLTCDSRCSKTLYENDHIYMDEKGASLGKEMAKGTY